MKRPGGGPALKVIPKHVLEARPPQERLSFQQWINGDFRLMRTLAVLFWCLVVFVSLLFLSGTTLFPFDSSLIFRLDSLWVWECMILFFVSQLILVPYEHKFIITFTRPIQPSRLLQVFQFLHWRRVVFFLLHFITSLFSLFSLLSLRASSTPFSPFTCTQLPLESSDSDSPPDSPSDFPSDAPSDAPSDSPSPLFPTIPDGYICLEETTLLYLQFCFVFSLLFSIFYFLTESNYLILPLTYSPPFRTFSSYFVSLAPFSLLLSLLSCLLTFGGRFILGTYLSQMFLNVLSWFLGKKIIFLVIREGQWGWMIFAAFHAATVIGACWIGRHSVLKVLSTLRFCFYDRVNKGFRVNYDAKVSKEDMFLVQALCHQDNLIAGLARLDLFYLLRFDQGRRMTIFDDDIRRSPCLIAEELLTDIDNLTYFLDRITHMNLMKEQKDEQAKRDIERRMMEEKEREERQKKMKDGEGGRKGGRGGKRRDGILAPLTPVSFGRLVEEVRRTIQDKWQNIMGRAPNRNHNNSYNNHNNHNHIQSPPQNSFQSPSSYAASPYVSPYQPRQQHHQLQHQDQQFQSPFVRRGETQRRGDGRDELMSPFRQPNQPSTNTPGLRGEEGIRRRIGREGGEWERERESDFKVEREGKKGVGELMRNYFEQNFLQPFDGWRQTGVALADYQRFRLSIECLSLLLQVSAEEDHMGILNVSGYFEDSICSLLSCLIALEIHMRTTSPPHPKTSQSVRLPSYSLLLVLQNAIYSIVVKYYSSLSSLKLPPSHTQKLQEFVSFQVM